MSTLPYVFVSGGLTHYARALRYLSLVSVPDLSSSFSSGALNFLSLLHDENNLCSNGCTLL
jgi:hypothetical protein